MSGREQLERRIEAYLDGALDPEQTAAFERELVKPKVARALEQALAQRDVLSRDAGDGPPPPTGAARIERGDGATVKTSLQRARAAPANADAPTRRQRGPSALEAALHGTSWIVRGPAMAFTAPGTKAALSGLASVRFALGPLLAHWPPARAASGTIEDNRPVHAVSKAVALVAKARGFTARNPWLQMALRRIVR